MTPRTAGFGNRDRFELNGKIELQRAAGLIVLRECRQWQHNNVALSGSIPLQPAPFWGKFNLWRIVVSENPVYGTSHIIKRRPLWSRFGVLGSTSPERNTLYDEY